MAECARFGEEVGGSLLSFLELVQEVGQGFCALEFKAGVVGVIRSDEGLLFFGLFVG